MRIGEVSRRSGVSVRMLRHYDALGLVSPSERTAAGYREYADADLRRIFHVEALRSLGMSLAETGEALSDSTHDTGATGGHARRSATQGGEDRAGTHGTHGTSGPSSVLDALIERTRSRIAAEQELLTRLEHTHARSPDDWEDVLTTIALLRAVRSDDPRTRHEAALTPDALPAAAFAEAALTEDELNVAGALRWAAGHAAGHASTVVAAATEALSADDPARRLRAVALLGDLDGPEVVRLLTSVLTDDDAEVRARAALTLASGRRDSSPDAPQGSATALAPRDSTTDVHPVSDAHPNSGPLRPADVRSEALLSGALLRDVLVQMVVEGTKDVEAAEALARLTTEGERAVARERDADRERTADAAAASAEVDAILDRLRDPTTPAAGRVRLVQALGEQPDAVIREVVAPFTDDEDPDVARIATYLAHRAAEQPRS